MDSEVGVGLGDAAEAEAAAGAIFTLQSSEMTNVCGVCTGDVLSLLVSSAVDGLMRSVMVVSWTLSARARSRSVHVELQLWNVWLLFKHIQRRHSWRTNHDDAMIVWTEAVCEACRRRQVWRRRGGGAKRAAVSKANERHQIANRQSFDRSVETSANICTR